LVPTYKDVEYVLRKYFSMKLAVIIFNKMASRIFQLVGWILIGMPSYMLYMLWKDVIRYVYLINV
jgi:hypothetical protein